LPGASRFLEIAVKPTSGSVFTTLSPREPVTSSPYAIRSLNATTADGLSLACLSCVTSSQIQSVQGSQISGLIPVASVPAGSGNYIQNTTTEQPSANFNISGNGTAVGTLLADTVRALTEFNLGGRVLSNFGIKNLFAGVLAGEQNSGGNNAFFGFAAGESNTSGFHNSFVGSGAGFNNRTGSDNTFIGFSAGFSVMGTDGGSNTALGALASVSPGISNSTAIGANAQVTTNHTIVLGTDQEVVDVPGKLQIDTLGTAGSTNLCLNGSNRVGTCSSSLRYKTNLRPFSGGLSIINHLLPMSFIWKDGGMRDVGLGAEDVARIEPLLTFTNSKGEIEGVKYNQLSVVFINAFKQQQGEIIEQQTRIKEREREASIQQAQIELYRKQLTLQQRQIRRQQYELESLKRMFYPGHTTADASKSRRHTR